jgi:hypothetical protein
VVPFEGHERFECRGQPFLASAFLRDPLAGGPQQPVEGDNRRDGLQAMEVVDGGMQ